MCTVTFLPLEENKFILTSSRDVPYSREKALEPKNYSEDSVDLIYPKDGKGSGTWIGTSSKNRLICLLNGGFKDHIQKEQYRMSRGLIVKALLKVNEISEGLAKIELNDIEPFTLVIVDWNNGLELFEFVWTGEKKHLINIPRLPHIWSSSTLYSSSEKKLREDWFINWQKEHSTFIQNEIIHFHKSAGAGNPKTNVLMKRDGGGTVSITSITKSSEGPQFIYEDVIAEKVSFLS